MSNIYQIYLISDSTGETLDRIFLALKAQFKNFTYKIHSYSFIRTQNQISKIIDISSNQSNSLTGLISVHVVRVFGNGNLEILGQKKLTLRLWNQDHLPLAITNLM